MTDPSQLKALLARLELETQKRRELKAASGEVLVIRDFVVCCGPDEDASALFEAAKVQEIARLRAEGEKREIVFDEETAGAVVTGVPRSWDDPDATTIQTSGVDPIVTGCGTLKPEPAEQERLPPRPPANIPPQYVRVQLQRPRDNFPGRIAEGKFEVRGDNLVLTDMEGEIIGGRQLLQGEDPAMAARELLRARDARDEFSEPTLRLA